ncbi:hypothetical protein [Nocardia sp. NPDC049149]|uniref:hypothetical protein n=1 Tax=Nocardia sp. NPDC049149 TaxID=3364315 RepID=UPI003711C604
MPTTTNTRGIARPMSGPAYNDDGDVIDLAHCYELNPPWHHGGRTIRYAMVTIGAIWGCDALGHLTGYGHQLGKRHGVNTPEQDLALLGYPVER